MKKIVNCVFALALALPLLLLILYPTLSIFARQALPADNLEGTVTPESYSGTISYSPYDQICRAVILTPDGQYHYVNHICFGGQSPNMWDPNSHLNPEMSSQSLVWYGYYSDTFVQPGNAYQAGQGVSPFVKIAYRDITASPNAVNYRSSTVYFIDTPSAIVASQYDMRQNGDRSIRAVCSLIPSFVIKDFNWQIASYMGFRTTVIFLALAPIILLYTLYQIICLAVFFIGRLSNNEK